MTFRTIPKAFRRAALALFALSLGMSAAYAEPYLVADADTGQTLIENQATQPWFPASVTKLMTTYVALSAVRDGRLTMDTPLTMSLRAARSAPSKMGFKPGTLVTLDNALKMLLVKSPNDVAVMVAESISGSVESFADEMNAAGRKIGLKESHFVNPNGLHDPNHYSSARDMAMIARALLKEFPEHADLFDIGAIQLGVQIIANHNGLLGRYPGADGMKTGFTCDSGFNVVASATRNGRHLIVVVFGSPSARERTNEAAQLFDRGFAQNSSGPALDSLAMAASTEAPDMRGEICSRRGRATRANMEEDFTSAAPAAVAAPMMGRAGGGMFAVASVTAPPVANPAIANERVHFDPIPVFVGPKPGWTGPVLAARADAAPASDDPKPIPQASAYTAEKPADAASPNELEAPVALQGAVKHPSRLTPKEARKPARIAVTAKPAPPKRPADAAKHAPAKPKV